MTESKIGLLQRWPWLSCCDIIVMFQMTFVEPS